MCWVVQKVWKSCNSDLQDVWCFFLFLLLSFFLSFADHCDKRGNFLRCVCQEGYAGHYCERLVGKMAWNKQFLSRFLYFTTNYIFLLSPPRCAPGYYGNPMVVGNSCKKCDCNGNSDPNLIFNECNNMTGQCLNCWANTAGDNCERCAPGFYGDAISAKDCRGRC